MRLLSFNEFLIIVTIYFREIVNKYFQYNIKNLKLKLRPDSEHQYNSPWNIAADFDINMSFSADQILGMLEEYENDYHTGMDMQSVAKEIYSYTSGYPVLVSSICKRIDKKIVGSVGFEKMKKAWSHEGIEKVVKEILIDRAPLFESMITHLNEYPELKKMFQAILFQGSELSYSPDTKEIALRVCSDMPRMWKERYRLQTAFLKHVCTIIFFPRKSYQA